MKALTPQEQSLIDAIMANPGKTDGQIFKKLKITADIGKRMLSRGHVREELQARREEARYDSMISCKRIMEEEACIAFTEYSELLDADGNLIPPNKLPERVRRAVTIEVKQIRDNRNLIKGIEYKYTMLNKANALERISKHLGLYEKDNLQKAINVYFMSHGDEGAPEAEVVPEIKTVKPVANKTVVLLE